ncbi:Fur family transcriptional regulator [Penaeicola halotolerans]|uniref:Fur family transcriptional regulator n=1 Tax=Penaeicola halotolerans TaxID=2793196 RepID=UPI001CF86065|nr:transcriptional repressor [Penaeicola halotolerans]
MSEAVSILKDNQLRITACREEVLGAFLDKGSALSHGDLELLFQETFDRVTIYRTLKTYLDAGIIHKVLDDSGAAKYALCKETCEHGHHHHEHVHFKCSVCGETNCIESVSIPDIKLPAGYVLEEANLLVQGKCAKCN